MYFVEKECKVQLLAKKLVKKTTETLYRLVLHAGQKLAVQTPERFSSLLTAYARPRGKGKKGDVQNQSQTIIK